MTETGTAHDKRAQHVALLGFVLQLAAFAVLCGISFWSDSHLLALLARFVIAGAPIWLVLYLVFNQMRRGAVEALETAELQRAQEAGAAQAIFELDDEALLLEQNRLRWMVRWLLPAVGIFVCLLLFAGHFVGWGWSLDSTFDKDGLKLTEDPTLWMWFVVGVGFVFFLYARYALALARLPQWQLLRAGAVFVAGNALGCLAVAIALMATGTVEWAEPLVAYVLRVVLILLGIEFGVNFILDLYRPRFRGEVPRPAFDSRLLGMIGEPGGIAKSIADAFNYQFGFQVSSTWFYQLLQRWLFPITVVAFATVLALTSVVIVDAGEEVVVERFGRHLSNPTETLSPGIHFKLPYPIDVVYRAPVKRVSELVIGEAIEQDDEDLRKAVIWTEPHEYVPELMLLVASPHLGTQPGKTEANSEARNAAGGTESVAVSLLKVSVPIHYRIKDPLKYLYTYHDPEKLMEVIAYQYLSDYAASVDIDFLIGVGRQDFNEELVRRLQNRLDSMSVGIEIVFAGIRGAHPPSEKNVAITFQSVVAAQTHMAATVHAAEGAAQKILTLMAGTVSHARSLDEAILARDGLEAESPELAEARERVDDLLAGNPAKGIASVSGNAAAQIANARARASRMVSGAIAKAGVFGTQVAAYQAAPMLYKQRRILSVYEEGLDDVRKYLITGDLTNIIIEYETAREAGLDQVLSEGVEKERKKNE